MPTLTWNAKNLAEPAPETLRVESVIYPQGQGYPAERPGNRLFQGDNFGIMSALLPEYEGRINLIYADPPFFTNRRYPARIGRGEDSRKPRDWQLTDGYPDNWSSLDDYLRSSTSGWRDGQAACAERDAVSSSGLARDAYARLLWMS
jgi:hypothetical protein